MQTSFFSHLPSINYFSSSKLKKDISSFYSQNKVTLLSLSAISVIGTAAYFVNKKSTSQAGSQDKTQTSRQEKTKEPIIPFTRVALPVKRSEEEKMRILSQIVCSPAEKKQADSWLESSEVTVKLKPYIKGQETVAKSEREENRAYGIYPVSPINREDEDLKTIFHCFERLERNFEHLADRLTSSQINLQQLLSHTETVTYQDTIANLNRIRAQNIRRFNYTPTNPAPRVAVIGQGIGGLIAALEAYKKGATVLRVEKRSAITRDQILRLDLETYNYLKENFGKLIEHMETFGAITERRGIADFNVFNLDDQSFNSRSPVTSDRFYTIETRDIEYLVNSVLDSLETSQKSSQKSSITSLNHHEFTGFAPHSSSREGEEGISCVLKSTAEEGEEIAFSANYIVGADGANSQTRRSADISWDPISTSTTSGVITFPNFFNELDFSTPQVLLDGAYKVRQQQNKELDSAQILACATPTSSIRPHEEILIKNASGQDVTIETSRLSYHLGIRPNNHRTRGLSEEANLLIAETQISFVHEGQEKYLESLKELNWGLNRLPINRLFTTGQTIYLGTDIPKDSFETMQEENKKPISERPTQHAFFRKVLEANLPRFVVNFLMPYVRSSFVFSSQLYQASESVKVISRGSSTAQLFLLGDAYATPQFQTGSGALVAIQEARAFGSFLDDLPSQTARNAAQNPIGVSRYKDTLRHRANEIAQKAFRLGVVDPSA